MHRTTFLAAAGVACLIFSAQHGCVEADKPPRSMPRSMPRSNAASHAEVNALVQAAKAQALRKPSPPCGTQTKTRDPRPRRLNKRGDTEDVVYVPPPGCQCETTEYAPDAYGDSCGGNIYCELAESSRTTCSAEAIFFGDDDKADLMLCVTQEEAQHAALMSNLPARWHTFGGAGADGRVVQTSHASLQCARLALMGTSPPAIIPRSQLLTEKLWTRKWC